jgi:hypothetical protein
VLQRLVEAGLLTRHRVAGAPDTYRLHLLERALARFGEALAVKDGIEQGAAS